MRIIQSLPGGQDTLAMSTFYNRQRAADSSTVLTLPGIKHLHEMDQKASCVARQGVYIEKVNVRLIFDGVAYWYLSSWYQQGNSDVIICSCILVLIVSV